MKVFYARGGGGGGEGERKKKKNWKIFEKKKPKNKFLADNTRGLITKTKPRPVASAAHPITGLKTKFR